jgi:hypothetical protein
MLPEMSLLEFLTIFLIVPAALLFLIWRAVAVRPTGTIEQDRKSKKYGTIAIVIIGAFFTVIFLGSYGYAFLVGGGL